MEAAQTTRSFAFGRSKISLLFILCLVAVVAWVLFGSRPDGSAESNQATTAGHSHDEVGHHHGEGDGHAHAHNHVRLQDVRLIEAFTFHPENGEECNLTYRLEEPAVVTMKVKKMGTRELYLATIVNSELREPGAHAETWDGRDYSGNIVDMSTATIVVRGDEPSELGSMPLDERSAEEIVHGHPQGHDHGTHHRWAEEVPWLRIVNPAQRTDLRGLVAIRCEVDKEKRGYGDKYGYGVRYYVDSTLAHEEFYKPESDGKFAYQLDTTAFEDGEHMLYVGMCDHHEHASSAGIPVVFNNSRN